MAAEALKVGDVGPQSELAARSNPSTLTLVYVPSLTALLTRAEALKGTPLSEAEVQRIARRAEVVAMRNEVAESVLQQRGGAK